MCEADRHDAVTKGYFENEEATKELIDEDGWMHTGDVGYFGANENLFVVDRKKDLIKYNALQIAPAEIEDVISSHPLVKEVGVIGVRDSRKIGEQVPRAYVALKDPSSSSDAETVITDHVAASLSHYKHLRGGVRVLDALPRNGVGKSIYQILVTHTSRRQYDESLGLNDSISSFCPTSRPGMVLTISPLASFASVPITAASTT
ncbi:hypothetical protein IEQ34_025157 [Dendrobium chrysotoxum]|uniref:AMP-binding enzyme C-terminal domain-containing protein n=1 Tax=Dendrobium chrysotoxum TaxID=161865 RepID=A0AAV7FQ06_DENCH|nr:hypothetical protein IEQ34_025157 [Dendrobium chrysotoxum]